MKKSLYLFMLYSNSLNLAQTVNWIASGSFQALEFLLLKNRRVKNGVMLKKKQKKIRIKINK